VGSFFSSSWGRPGGLLGLRFAQDSSGEFRQNFFGALLAMRGLNPPHPWRKIAPTAEAQKANSLKVLAVSL